MKLTEKDFKTLLDNIYDGVYFVDKKRQLLYWNKAAETITGYKAKEIIGRFCYDNILNHVDHTGKNLCRGLCPLVTCIKQNKLHEAEVYLHHKDGHRVPVWVRASPIHDEKGKPIGAIELFTDISNKEHTQLRIKELEKLSLLDELTQIANRRHIEDQIKARLEEFKRYQTPFGLLFFDIDHFKKFNDTYGHDMGDLVLKTTANTLKYSARPFDDFGRWGGEEFVCVIQNITRRNLIIVAERIRVLIETSHLKTKKHGDLNISVSIGATIVKKDDTVEAIVKRADTLMYKSKENGRNQVTIE